MISNDEGRNNSVTEEIDVRVPVDELTKLSFSCDCGTEITIDINTDKTSGFNWQQRSIKCPTCYNNFNDELKYALDRLVAFHDRINKANVKAFFRVKRG